MKQMTGKTLFDADTKAANFTQEDIEKSLEIVKALYDNNVCAPASYSSAYSNDDLQSDPNWIAGKYVSLLRLHLHDECYDRRQHQRHLHHRHPAHHGRRQERRLVLQLPAGSGSYPPPARTPRQP